MEHHFGGLGTQNEAVFSKLLGTIQNGVVFWIWYHLFLSCAFSWEIHLWNNVISLVFICLFAKLVHPFPLTCIHLSWAKNSRTFCHSRIEPRSTKRPRSIELGLDPLSTSRTLQKFIQEVGIEVVSKLDRSSHLSSSPFVNPPPKINKNSRNFLFSSCDLQESDLVF